MLILYSQLRVSAQLIHDIRRRKKLFDQGALLTFHIPTSKIHTHAEISDKDID